MLLASIMLKLRHYSGSKKGEMANQDEEVEDGGNEGTADNKNVSNDCEFCIWHWVCTPCLYLASGLYITAIFQPGFCRFSADGCGGEKLLDGVDCFLRWKRLFLEGAVDRYIGI